MQIKKHIKTRTPACNSRLPQWGLTWLNQVKCFYQSLCLVDSEVLRNPPLRQAAKRCKQYQKKKNMRKLFTIIMLVITSLTYSQTGEKNFIDQNYIEVTGTADMEIIPDQIYMKILIYEKEIKGNTTIDELEKSMISKLSEIRLDVNKDLAVIDLSSNFKYYFLKENKIYLSKEYELKVKDAKTAGLVIQELEKLNISNITISKVDHSKIDQFKNQIKINAIKAAREKAEALVYEIGQSVGRAIYIEELDNIRIINSLSGKVSGVQVSNITIRGAMSDEVVQTEPEIEFEKIELQYSIMVRFELK